MVSMCVWVCAHSVKYFIVIKQTANYHPLTGLCYACPYSTTTKQTKGPVYF